MAIAPTTGMRSAASRWTIAGSDGDQHRGDEQNAAGGADERRGDAGRDDRSHAIAIAGAVRLGDDPRHCDVRTPNSVSAA